MKKRGTKGLRARLGRRGAAMVEAAVVLPVMICTLGLSMMIRNAYYTKILSNQNVRNTVFANASNNCSGGTSGSSQIDQETQTPNLGQASGAIGAVPGGSGLTSGIMQTYSNNYSGTTIDNPLPNTATDGQGLHIPVKGESSFALCNEKPLGGGFSGLFGYIGSIIKSIF